MTLLSDQVLDLAGGWRTAWMHEMRGAHGEWTREVGAMEQRAGHLEVRGRQEAVQVRQGVGAHTPSGLLHRQIRQIEQEQARAVQHAPRAVFPSNPTERTRSFLQGESPAPTAGLRAGPERPAASQAIPAIDHRVVMAYSANARNVIAKAAQQGELTPAQAKTIGDAVDSLARTATAADRQIQQLQSAQSRNDERMAVMEQAIRELHERSSAEIHNERVKDRLMAIRQKHDEMVADARENATAKSRLLIGVSGAFSTLALTIGGFLGLPGGAPASPHEWMLAIIPVATAVGAAFVQPIYERMMENKLARKTARLRIEEANKAQAATDLQAGRDIIPAAPPVKQLSNQNAQQGAIEFLTTCFAQCGLSGTQASELAEYLTDNA